MTSIFLLFLRFIHFFIDNDDFKSFFDLCKRFNVTWFHKRIENFLIQQDHSQFSVTKFSLYFSLAKTFHLTDLNEKLEKDFINKFKDDEGKEDYFMIAKHFDLKRAQRELENKMMVVKRKSYRAYVQRKDVTVEDLLLCETYHYEKWKTQLISKCKLSTLIKLIGETAFSKLHEETIFQLINTSITSWYEQRSFQDDSDWNTSFKFLEILEDFKNRKIRNNCMSKPAKESTDITDMIKDEKTPIENPFNRESNTDCLLYTSPSPRDS